MDKSIPINSLVVFPLRNSPEIQGENSQLNQHTASELRSRNSCPNESRPKLPNDDKNAAFNGLPTQAASLSEARASLANPLQLGSEKHQAETRSRDRENYPVMDKAVIVITPDDAAFMQAKRTAAHKLSLMHPSTVETYKREVKRALGQELPTTSRCKSTLRVKRAAIRWYQLHAAMRCKDLSKFLRACSTFKWDANQIIQSILENKWTYVGVPQLSDQQPSTSHKPNTKRNLLSQLPSNWRQQFVAGVQSSTPGMREAFLLMAISGCRPSELATTTLTLSEKNVLTIHIVSAKRRIHQIGDWRAMRLPLPTAYGDCRGLFDSFVVAQLRRITPKQISDSARKVSKRVFPSLGERVTASTFRHQFCSDLKSRGCTKREIALSLGHSMIESQNAYGRPRFGYIEQIKIEISGSYEPSEPNSERARTFLDITVGHDLPEP
jgi:integrase